MEQQELLTTVYDDMRRMAAAYLRAERSGDVPQPTSLVHEVFLKFAKRRDLGISSQRELLGVAAHLMRLALVDRARRRQRLKRQPPAAGSENPGADQLAFRHLDVLAVDRALQELEILDARQAKIVELRYFCELGVEEAGITLGISSRTVKREWALAKAWLKTRVSPGTEETCCETPSRNTSK